MKKTIIVSYAKKGREDYPKAIERLVCSALDNGYKGDFFIYCPEYEADIIIHNGIEVPIHKHIDSRFTFLPHDVLPYGFKYFLMNMFVKASSVDGLDMFFRSPYKENEYDRVIWADSTIVFNKEGFEEKLFEKVEGQTNNEVFCFENIGFPMRDWFDPSNLNILDKLTKKGGLVPKDYVSNDKQVMGCLLGYEFEHRVINRTYSNVIRSLSFFKSPSNHPKHRHDQSVLSYFTNEMKKPFENGFCYYDFLLSHNLNPDDFYFFNKGLYL